MDFFHHQDRARKHTTVMIVLFLAAVVCIVLAINIVGGIIYVLAAKIPVHPPGEALAAVPRSAYWVTTAVVLAVIGFGTVTRLRALSGGGSAVAELVGARRVSRDSSDDLERRLLNVVEEMAIASGINVPQVYVMEKQQGINAFAAGYSPNEAAIMVTYGTLEQLNRDELQGVIGHEFSHILNGDMRLNVRLMGVIAGIVMIAALGRFVMEAGNRRGSGKRGGDVRLVMLGLALWLIGSIGEFFGTLIKAAISRQREFLADASAVQFTRNPSGIGGALYKISQRGSHVYERHAEEFSHMYFGEPVAHMLFATHPPLDLRIERVMGPGAKHVLRDRIKRQSSTAASASRGAQDNGSPVVADFVSPLYALAPAVPVAPASPGPAPAAASLALTPSAVMDSIGTLSGQHVEHARRLLCTLPQRVREAIAEESGARAALFALLLGENEIRLRQLDAIAREAGQSIADQTAFMAEALAAAGVRVRLPLFELAAPILGNLSQETRDATQALVNVLIQADGKVSLGEFVLLTLCRRHLEKPAKGAPPVKHRTLHSVAKEAATVLAMLARSSPAGEAAYARVLGALELSSLGPKLPPFTLSTVEAALYELKLLTPLKKPVLIKACLELVMADGRITVTEGELMRAICAALDTPLPPLLEDASSWKEASPAASSVREAMRS